jgi:hypothetical protein
LQANRSGIRLLEEQQQSEEGGLASTIRPEDRQDFTGSNPELGDVHHDSIAIGPP